MFCVKRGKKHEPTILNNNPSSFVLMQTCCVMCASHLCIEIILIGVVFVLQIMSAIFSVKPESMNYSSICNVVRWRWRFFVVFFSSLVCWTMCQPKCTEKKKIKLSQWIYCFLFIFFEHFLFASQKNSFACVGVALLPVIILDAVIPFRFHQICIQSAVQCSH